MKNKENLKNKIIDNFKSISEEKDIDSIEFVDKFAKSLIREYPVPEGTLCEKCGSTNLIRKAMLLSGPYSGHIICNECGFSTTVYSHIAKTCIKIEPMKL